MLTLIRSYFTRNLCVGYIIVNCYKYMGDLESDSEMVNAVHIKDV